MEPRIDFERVAPDVIRAMFGLGNYLNQTGLDPKLQNLVKIRASQADGSRGGGVVLT